MNNDFKTKTTKPQSPKTDTKPVPLPKKPLDLASHPDAIEAGLGNKLSTTPAAGGESLNNNSYTEPIGGKRTKKPRRSPKQWFKDLSKKQKILLIVSILILLIGGTASAYYLTRSEPAPAPQAVQPEPPKPTTEASKLTGVQVKPEMNKRSITAVMIENSTDARPQSGLADAGVVFEAIAEGGITRFLTLFQESQPKNLGPVRSVRPYYIDWLQGFDAAVAHAGGSPDGLAKIRNEGVKDLDQFANPVAYRREASRVSPHNLYTSTAALDKLKTEKKFTSTNFDGFARKEEKASKTPTAKSIDFNISSFNFNPHYDYVAKTNSYNRSLAGVPHTDLNTKKQINVKVVVAMIMNYGIAANGVNSAYNSIGSGKVYVFQDGNVTEGTWEKTGSKKQVVFKDKNKKVIKLNPGNTWISAVGSATGVSYK